MAVLSLYGWPRPAPGMSNTTLAVAPVGVISVYASRCLVENHALQFLLVDVSGGRVSGCES